MSVNNKIKILFWNCNSIKSKIILLYDYLITNKIHIACLSETFLKNNEHIHSHPQYSIHRLDRTDDTRGGGVAILIHKNIKYELLSDMNLRYIECIGIELLIDNQNKIQIFSVYVPGTENTRLLENYFINDLRKITSRRHCYFACGDFNARHRSWNCFRANKAGNLLHQESQLRDFVVLHPDTPTYYPEDPSRLPSTIDLALSNGSYQYSDLLGEYIGSDHHGVTFDIFIDKPTLQGNNQKVRAYRDANWHLFQTYVNRKLIPYQVSPTEIDSEMKIDELIEKFTNTLLEAEELAIPLVNPNKYEIQLTPVIKQKIALRNIFRHQWQLNRSNRALKTMVNSLNQEIKTRINELRNENWSKKLQLMDQDEHHKNLWRVTKFLRNKDKSIPPLKHDNELYITPAEKAELIANKFEEFHQNPLQDNDPRFTSDINRITNNYLMGDSNTEPELPSIDELYQHTSTLKVSKAPGQDMIRNSLIKNLPLNGMKFLHTIICACLLLNYFPHKWKSATIIPILKPGKSPTVVGSYRPISLLSSISKILEKVILARITQFTEQHNIIPPYQHGFRAGYSTSHQLKRVISKLKCNLHDRFSSGMLLFDVEKAYDRVWHNALLHKMIANNFPRYLVRIIASFLKNRNFQVSVSNKKSTVKNAKYGLPQGAVLSPILYNIFTSDVPQVEACEIACYADDTAIYDGSRKWTTVNRNLKTTWSTFHAYFEK